MGSQISGSGLYNGNITWQITQLNRLAESLGTSNDTFGIRASAYKYDQLNRLLSTATFTSNNSGVLTVAKNKWNASYGYDRNGNIRTASVRGNGILMDSLQYNYAIDGNKYLTTNNRLNSVQDLTGSLNDGTYTTDINSGQLANNYTYDAIGNLIGDVSHWLVTLHLASVVPFRPTDK